MRMAVRLTFPLYLPAALALLTAGCKASTSPAPAAPAAPVVATAAPAASAPNPTASAPTAAIAASSGTTAAPAPPTAAQIAAVQKQTSPIVTMVTTRGTILIKLFPKDAPISVANFENLVSRGFYNGLTFHRITDLDPSTPSKIVQGGDPNGDGSGGPGYTIKGEFQSNGVSNPLTHVAGAVAMARTSAPDSAGSQFYICVNPVHFLDNNYAVFGQVIKGLSVAGKLQVGDKMTHVTLEK